jgi:hypothetical protein
VSDVAHGDQEEEEQVAIDGWHGVDSSCCRRGR